MIILEGLDWQWGDQNGDDESIGTVYRVKRRGEVYVSWHIAFRASKSNNKNLYHIYGYISLPLY